MNASQFKGIFKLKTVLKRDFEEVEEDNGEIAYYFPTSEEYYLKASFDPKTGKATVLYCGVERESTEYNRAKYSVTGAIRNTLCWECVNAVPVNGTHGCYANGCPWSVSFKPVDGWEAKPTRIKSHEQISNKSYEVYKCPLFRVG